MAAALTPTVKNGYVTASTNTGYTIDHDDVTRDLEEFIKNHPMVVKLNSQSDYSGSRPYSHTSQSDTLHSFIGRTLRGPEKIAVSPLTWIKKDGRSLIQILYLGSDLCGHSGVVHGGMLATMLDDGFANCCSAALPNKIGVTANLNINYCTPVSSGDFVVLRANTTKIEGRKIWVEGHIEALMTEGEKPVVMVKASALFIGLR
ncbi:Vacuolar ATP synthase subunit C [Pseudogymnoascus australis]